jgi:uroporphyrinogen III methyltransferase/synthase
MTSEHAPANSISKGHVYLVGAGPGDPGLLTLKGAAYLREADVVLYDELLDRRLLDLPSARCERIYVGKRGGRKSHSQQQINALLVEHARQGRAVVRLKGGDPLVFGRGGEEALLLRAAGIPFEIVPGISAASGATTYAGIPLTHRGLASVAVLVTGNEDPDKKENGVDWPRLAAMDATLVVFMAARKLDVICQTLIDNGRPAHTPAAVVEWGTWPEQRTITDTLEHLATRAAAAQIKSPALVVVGPVVNLREQLNWREGKKLFGKRILITRSKEQSADLWTLLESHGAEVHSLPLLEIAPPNDWAALDATILNLASFAWVLFTSPNSVHFFFERLYQLGKDARALSSTRVAAVGLATAERLLERSIRPDLVPDEQSQQGLAKAFADIDVSGAKILFPASSIGRTHLFEVLTQRGAEVLHVTAYQNCAPKRGAADLPTALLENKVDMVVFASPSSVQHLQPVIGSDLAAQLKARARIACIGPTTAAAALARGLEVDVQPAQSSIAALVDAICAYYAQDAP